MSLASLLKMSATVDFELESSSQILEMLEEYIFQCRNALEQIKDCVFLEKKGAEPRGGDEACLEARVDSQNVDVASEMTEAVGAPIVQEEQNLKVLLSDALADRGRLMNALEESRTESGGRMTRIGQLQELNLEVIKSLEEEKKRREELQLELAFQRDVSKHLARYVRSMKSEVKNLRQQYNQVEASLELTRCTFAAHERKQKIHEDHIKEIEQLCRLQRSKMEEQMEKQREFELREMKFREIEEEKDSSICAKNTVIESMEAELEQERSRFEAVSEELQKLSLLVERQFRLCEKEQARNKSMASELIRLKDSGGLKGLEERVREAVEKSECEIQELNGKLEAEKLRSEQLSTRYDEILKKTSRSLLEMKKQRDEAIEAATRAMEREKSSKRAMELRDGMRSSPCVGMSFDRDFCVHDIKMVDRGGRVIEKKSVDELVDEILSKESTDIEEPSESLLQTSVYENRKGRAGREVMKCCSDLPYGLNIRCNKCKGSFHMTCAEKMSPSSSRKKRSKFVCAECKAKSRSLIQTKTPSSK